MKKLSILEKDVVAAYLDPKHNHDATKAYLSVRPHVKPRAASVAACKMLQRPHVQDAINKAKEKAITKAADKNIASKDYLIQEAHEIGLEARQGGKLQTALNAVDQKAKLNRLYNEDKNSGIDGYRTLIQNLIIQGDVNMTKTDNNEDNNNAIDITPANKQHNIEAEYRECE